MKTTPIANKRIMKTTPIANNRTWNELSKTDRKTVIRIIGWRPWLGLEHRSFEKFLPYPQQVILAAIRSATKIEVSV